MNVLDTKALNILERLCDNELGHVNSWQVLSTTNNPILLADTDRGHLVVKIVRDLGIEPELLQHFNQIAHQAGVDTPKIMSIVPIEQPQAQVYLGGRALMVQQFVQGQDVAYRLERSLMREADFEQLVETMLTIVSLLANQNNPRQGFGLIKRNRPMNATLKEFIKGYIERYTGRLADLDGGQRAMWNDVQRTLVDLFHEKIEPTVSKCVLFCADLNLKNFVVSNSGKMVVLNMPLMGYGDMRHGWAAASVQLRGTPWRSKLLERLPHAQKHTKEIEFYEALIMLGILAFYGAAGGPQAVQQAQSWGTNLPLLDSFTQTLDLLTQ